MRIWARKGTRPRLPADQRYQNTYLFGAICPKRGTGAALVLPTANTEAMQLHLEEISKHVARKAHAVVLMDRAGWHTTGKLSMPQNITPTLLPSKPTELHPPSHSLHRNQLSRYISKSPVTHVNQLALNPSL
mgnify:CR=1 FL=1